MEYIFVDTENTGDAGIHSAKWGIDDVFNVLYANKFRSLWL